MASMQLGGPDGLHYSYSYRVSFGKSKVVENYEDVVEDEEDSNENVFTGEDKSIEAAASKKRARRTVNEDKDFTVKGTAEDLRDLTTF